MTRATYSARREAQDVLVECNGEIVARDQIANRRAGWGRAWNVSVAGQAWEYRFGVFRQDLVARRLGDQEQVMAATARTGVMTFVGFGVTRWDVVTPTATWILERDGFRASSWQIFRDGNPAGHGSAKLLRYEPRLVLTVEVPVAEAVFLLASIQHARSHSSGSS